MSIAAAIKVNAPLTWNTKTAATAAGTFHSLGTAIKVWMKADAKVHIRFGADSASATLTATTAGYLTADQDYIVDVPSGAVGFRIAGASTPRIFWADVS